MKSTRRLRRTRMRTPLRTLGVAAAAMSVVLAGAACSAGTGQGQAEATGPANLQILIASSGDAETKAVKDAAAAWAAASGNTAIVSPAQDIGQQLGQAFAGDAPPDVFYVDAGRFADYASVGAL